MCPRKRVGLVSGVVPHISSCGALVSARPSITSWRYLGMPPTGSVSGEMSRSRTVTPLEYDLLEFLVGFIAAPVVLPAFMLRSVAEAVEEQARYETDVESMLRDELLENEMRYESGEISEEVYGKRKAHLTKRLEELEK